MFDFQQHEAVSQVFMPFCKQAQNPSIYSDFFSLYNVRLIEYKYSWVWRSQLDPKADVADHLERVLK